MFQAITLNKQETLNVKPRPYAKPSLSNLLPNYIQIIIPSKNTPPIKNLGI